MQFDQFAGNYQEVLDRAVAASGEGSAYFAEYKAQYLARTLPRKSFERVLDYGCGVGLLSGFLHKHLQPTRLDGFDVSADSIAQANASLRNSGTFTSDRNQLRTDYTLIVIANVLHHVEPIERASVIRDLSSRLTTGGTLAIFEHNPANPITRRTVDRCPFDEGVVLLPAAETLQLIQTTKLRRLRRDYIVFMPHALAGLRFLEPSLAWLPLGAQYVVLGEKRG
jgi:2-polyprenyl-3-methyl-5-hydroxy-6-metoxy-1,4-benzoquinol methylase